MGVAQENRRAKLEAGALHHRPCAGLQAGDDVRGTAEKEAEEVGEPMPERWDTRGRREFLPGPWRIDRDSRPGMRWNNHVVQEANPNMTVCFMAHDGTRENDRGEANARLVAAAPGLLDACASVWMELCDTDDPRLRKIAEECREAIGDALEAKD
jgi:hypothetical protein